MKFYDGQIHQWYGRSFLELLAFGGAFAFCPIAQMGVLSAAFWSNQKMHTQSMHMFLAI